jgi:hypothetical protein
MRGLLWVLLVFSVLSSLGCVAGAIGSSRKGKGKSKVQGEITKSDFVLMAAGAMTIYVDVIGGVAGVALTVAVLDDTGAKTLAGCLTAVPLGFLAVIAVNELTPPRKSG